MFLCRNVRTASGPDKPPAKVLRNFKSCNISPLKILPHQDKHNPSGTSPDGFFRRVVDLYAGGFREMTVGRRLWAIILIKLAVMFLVFKLFFFPDRLREEYDNDADRARAARSELMNPR